LIVNKDISKLQISVDDALTVDIDQSLYDLTDIHPCLEFSESLPAFRQIFKSVVSAILKQDVDILLILESIDELDDVLVPQ
jgi:cytolysin (calcineurin-like family phosphatase)